ncbi:AAA family ATPase [Streptomyces flaveolus]|uniref:AAA family ATPase n=1 Tax=Streptomyces flaveolus TaxID=67297 RepID=UPI0033AC71D9
MVNVPHASMRLWNSMKNFEPKISVRRIDFKEGSPFEGQSVDLAPVTLIAGTHGAGKTTLLSLISECLRADSRSHDIPPFIRPQRKIQAFLGGHHSITIRADGEQKQIDADLSLTREAWRNQPTSGMELNPIYQDAYDVSSDIQIFFQDVSPGFLEDDLDGDPWRQKRRDLDALRGILGISYDEATYYPIDVSHIGFPFPYVRARHGDTWTDSFQMSYGELTVHLIRWSIRNSPENSVLLLDEPEANIAPRGRAALLDEMAFLARSADKQMIIATHSAEFMSRVPLSCIRMCVRLGDSRAVLNPSRPADLRDALGVDHPLRFFVIVEDEVAAASLGLILTANQFPFLGETEVLQAGSWSDVMVTTRSLSTSTRVRAAAVLDGDQRGILKSSDTSQEVLFLPGSEPPEKVFVQHAARHPEEFARRLDCSIQSISVYIAEMLGVDHHRWLTLLAKRTGHDWRYCLRVAFDIWHSNPDNAAETKSLVEQVMTALQHGFAQRGGSNQ